MTQFMAYYGDGGYAVPSGIELIKVQFAGVYKGVKHFIIQGEFIQIIG